MRAVKIHDLSNIPSDVKVIWEMIEDSGFETYLVGGAVRDMILGLDPHDFDLATGATPEDIEEIFSDLEGFKLDFVGASFGVMLVNGIEVATFLGDNYDEDGNLSGVTFCNTIKEDLARRDFTINAMALTSSGILIDPFDGSNDLEKGIIKFVGRPSERIVEDPVRMIRACRFIGKLNFLPATSTLMACWDCCDLVKTIAPERIRIEILKAMEADKPSIFFDSLCLTDLLPFIFPELADSIGHTGGKHHPESVWEHNMFVGDALPKSDPILRLAGFLHDIGKPEAWKQCIAENRGGQFTNHHYIGSDILEVRLAELKFSNQEISKICGLVNCHMFFIKGLTPRAQRKLLKRLDEFNVNWRDLVRLRIADHNGNLGKPFITISEIKEIIKSFTQVESSPRDVKSLPVSGGQIINEFQLVPGRIVSDVQKALLSFVLETGVDDEDCLLLQCQKILDEVQNG